MHLQINHRFHAVGQGLFASGDLNIDQEPPFRWVYDCGTVSAKKFLNQQISALADRCSVSDNRPHLDLVAISHFDQDHINGLVELLKTFSVGTLLLPYMSVSQRLLVAFDCGLQPRQRLFDFFVEPIRYLSSRSNAEIEQFVFVQGGSGKTPPPTDSVGGEARRVLKNSQEESAPPLLFDWDEELPKDENYDGFQVRFLKKGARLVARNVWEFVPYNDVATVAVPPPSFDKAVTARKTELLEAGTAKLRKEALTELKRIYDARFGNSSEARNKISLFLYAGPTVTTYRSLGSYYLEKYSDTESSGRSTPAWSRYWNVRKKRSCCAALYTGDGSLDTKIRLDLLINHLGKTRVNRIHSLQVMHHGAESSWHTGVAQALRPRISVFSCDPGNKRYKHPHGPVVRDFLPFEPILVDRERSLFIRHSASVPLSAMPPYCAGASGIVASVGILQEGVHHKR